jgi:TonB family protein
MRDLESNLAKDTGLSLAAHSVAAGVLYLLLLVHHSQTVIANLDMTLAAITVQQSAQSKSVDEWILPNPNKKNHRALQKVVPEKVAPEVEKSVWVPAAQTSRQPRWVGNLIDPDNYPVVARQQGGDGRVVLLVHIDAAGKVQEVRLLNGSNYDVLNEFAVSKVRNGIFTPAYDKQGVPVSCEVVLPIIFKLVG